MNWAIILSLELILVDGYCSEAPGTLLQNEKIFRTVEVVRKEGFFQMVFSEPAVSGSLWELHKYVNA